MNDQGLDMLGSNDDATPEKGQAAVTEPELHNDAMSKSLIGLPAPVQLKIATISARWQIDPKADPIYALVESVELGAQCAVAATNSAQAAIAAAKAVQAGVAAIPDQIWTGAVRASDEVKGGLVAGSKAFVEAFTNAAADRQAALIAAVDAQQSSILSAATVGADKIKRAAETLTSSLDKAVAAKREEGVADFARAAAVAGKAAAQSSMAAQLSRSAMVSVMAFCVAVMIGAGGLWGWLLISHRVMPAGVVAMQDPLRGGDLLIVPTGGKPIPGRECPGGLCLIYKKGSVPDLP